MIHAVVGLKSCSKLYVICSRTFSPEALGIVPGAIFLICLIICLVGFATNHPSKVNPCCIMSTRFT